MSTNMKSSGAGLSRRSFLAGAAVAGAATFSGVMSGCAPQSAAESSTTGSGAIQASGVPETWDKETDVIVVGYGGAGAAAAWEALQAGSNVVILEQGDKAGGSTNICGGLITMGGGTETQKAAGFEETVDNYYNFLVAAGGPGVSEEHCRVVADKSLDLYDWLVNTIGVEFKSGYNPPWPEEANYEAGLACTGDEYNRDYEGIAEAVPHSHWVDGYETPEGSLTGSKNGSGFFQPLMQAVEEMSPEVYYDTPARQLIVNESGRVVGVIAQEKGKEISIKASQAVILTTGGFAMNEAMVSQYVPYAEGSFVIGTAGDMGDGIRMGQGVGADTRHMNFAYGQLSTSTWMYRNSVVGGPLISGILVSQRGLRFISEDHYSGSYYAQIVRNPYYYSDYNPFYMIYDSTILNEMIEIAEVKPEVVAATGNTITELAEALGMPEGSLEATMEYYNRYAEAGEDPLWKKNSQWIKPIVTPPFYAMTATTLNGLFSLGGLKINADAQVIHALTQEPIAGLYSAGRNASDIFGTGYQASGASIASCYTFGRIAGAKAAAETS